MKKIYEEAGHIDRSRWEEKGEWDKEPDKVHFVDEATDMDCLIVRNDMGGLCGYVAVEEGHPFFGKNYSEVDVSVHGGLTYSDFCLENGKICHIPREGKPDHVWWLGFDCGHANDLLPGIPALSLLNPEYRAYRNLDYVVNECQRLAAQLHEA